MLNAVFCGDCGVRSNPNRFRCPQCGGKLPHSHVRENPALYAKVSQELPPAAVFDLDMTLFNSEQRFKDARRGGFVDKDGRAVVKGMMSKGQAQRKRDNFLYSQKQLRKDQVIPGAKELVTDLVNEGYTIVYLTGRPKAHFEPTFNQLEYFGFPIFRDRYGEPLLKMKEKLGEQVAKYKANELRELSGNYKIQMFYDDDEKALKEAAKLRIPGLYSTVSDHVKHNSRHRNHRDDDDDHAPAPVPLQNPMPKPKRKKQKNGKFRQENVKRYVSRLMGLPKMKKDYPDSAQRFAVAMSLVEKYYSKAKREQYYPKVKANPANPKKIEKAKKLYEHMNKTSPDTVVTEKIDIGDVWYQVGEGGAWQIGYMSGKETGKKNQKYIHTFNEESKDGNFPKLYATMPDNGEPMLIIRGGSWKIKLDDTDTAWIYN